jgi:hypothetical protein
MDNDNTNPDTFGGYREAIKRLGIADLIGLGSEDKRATFEDYVVKSIFYSKYRINAHTKMAADLFFDGTLVAKEGKLGDTLLLMQLGKVVDKLDDLTGRTVWVDNIASVREELIENVYGNGKHKPGLRRYRNTSGFYITDPTDHIREQLDKSLKRLSIRHDDPIDSFVEGVTFFAEFSKIHPFEDANGRITRLLYNWYVINNDLRAIHVTGELRDQYTLSLDPYYHADHLPPIAVALFLLTLSPSRMNKLIDRLKGMESDSPHMLEIKDLILLHAGKIDNEKLRSDVERLFEMGLQTNHGFAYGALWLSSFAKLDSGILRRAYAESGSDERLRVMALYAMGAVDFEKYKQEITSALFNDPSVNARAHAAMQLGCHGAIDGKIGDAVIGRREDNYVLMCLGRAFTFKAWPPFNKRDATITTAAEKLMQHENMNVRVIGHQAFMAHAEEDRILASLVQDFSEYPPLIKKETVAELRRSGRLNSPRIADAICAIAINDASIRVPLLGELALLPESSSSYIPVFNHVLKSEKSSDGERAHAIYLLGRELGSDHIYGDMMGYMNMESRAERLALLLSYFDSLDKSISNNTDLPVHNIPAIMFTREGVHALEKSLIASELGRHLSRNGNGNGHVDIPIVQPSVDLGAIASLHRDGGYDERFYSRILHRFEEHHGKMDRALHAIFRHGRIDRTRLR